MFIFCFLFSLFFFSFFFFSFFIFHFGGFCCCCKRWADCLAVQMSRERSVQLLPYLRYAYQCVICVMKYSSCADLLSVFLFLFFVHPPPPQLSATGAFFIFFKMMMMRIMMLIIRACHLFLWPPGFCFPFLSSLPSPPPPPPPLNFFIFFTRLKKSRQPMFVVMGVWGSCS